MNKVVAIDGTMIHNPVGYCDCKSHEGYLNKALIQKHKCLGKKCKHLCLHENISFKCKYKKKWIFHEKDFDEVHAKKELGDVMWYVALICDSFGWNLDEILGMNIDKLKARYPKGFDTVLANNRKEGDI